MTRKLLCLFLFLYLSACAPLSQHESRWEQVGEIAGRTIAAPLTLGASEWLFAIEAKSVRTRRADVAWYRSLPAEERDRVDRREAGRFQALGFALSGGGPFRAPQTIVTVRPAAVSPGFLPHMTCLSLPAGTLTTMDCY